MLKLSLLLLIAFFHFPGFAQEGDETALEEVIEESRPVTPAPAKTTDAPDLTLIPTQPADLFDDRIRANFQKILEQAEMYKMPRESIALLIDQKAQGSVVEKLFQWAPSLKEISIDLVKDKKALPGLIELFGRKEDLKVYLYIWIGLVIFGFLMKKLFIREDWHFFSRRLVGISISLVLSVFSLYIFYNMFEYEVDPTVQIIKNYL